MDLVTHILGSEKQQQAAHSHLLAALREPVERLRLLGHWLLQAEGHASAFLACPEQVQVAAAASSLLAWAARCQRLLAGCRIPPRADDMPLPPTLRGSARDRNDLRRALALLKRCVLDQAAALALEATPHDTPEALAAYGASQRVRSRIAEMEHYLAWAGIALPQPH